MSMGIKYFFLSNLFLGFLLRTTKYYNIPYQLPLFPFITVTPSNEDQLS